MGIVSNFTNAIAARIEDVRGALSLAGEDRADLALQTVADQLHDFREEALQMARVAATARGGEMESVNLQDYYRAAKQVMDRANAELPEGATLYNIQQFGDMRGHTLDNFEFRQADIDVITSDDDPLGLNLDERGLQFSLSGSTLSNVSFIPATTFNSMGIDSTGDITINGAIFHGMESTQVLHLAAGEYSDISVVHVNAPPDSDGRTDRTGAIIQLDSGARVDGLDVSGQTISFVLAPRSTLNGVNTEGASILHFNAEGASVQDARFLASTFAMKSNMTGMQWSSATFEDVNIQNVDLSNNRFTNCGFTFTDTERVPEPLKEVNLTGARMDGVTLNLTDDETNRTQLSFADLERLGVNPGEMPSINGQTYQQYMVQMMHEQIIEQAAAIQPATPAPVEQAQTRAYAPGSAQEEIQNIRNLFTGEKSGLILAAAHTDEIVGQFVPQTDAAKTAIADRNADWATSAAVINMANNNNGE